MIRSTPKMALAGLVLGLVLASLVYNTSTPTRISYSYAGNETSDITTDYAYWLTLAVSGVAFATLGWAIAAVVRRYDRPEKR